MFGGNRNFEEAKEHNADYVCSCACLWGVHYFFAQMKSVHQQCCIALCGFDCVCAFVHFLLVHLPITQVQLRLQRCDALRNRFDCAMSSVCMWRAHTPSPQVELGLGQCNRAHYGFIRQFAYLSVCVAHALSPDTDGVTSSAMQEGSMGYSPEGDAAFGQYLWAQGFAPSCTSDRFSSACLKLHLGHWAERMCTN